MCFPTKMPKMPTYAAAPDPAPTPTYAKYAAAPGLWMKESMRRVSGGTGQVTQAPKLKAE